MMKPYGLLALINTESSSSIESFTYQIEGI